MEINSMVSLAHRRVSGSFRWTASLILTLAMVAGCAAEKQPLQVQLTQIAPYNRAAKPPSCNMPLLDKMPLTRFKQVAIVEAWADERDEQTDVMPALQRKACETGADALVIINSEHQDIKNLLYRASPNEQMTETTEKNAYATSADYIQAAEHTRRIGEVGHNGFYIDAVAINYVHQKNQPLFGPGSPTVSMPAPPPNG
jgi:hypothetical protein